MLYNAAIVFKFGLLNLYVTLLLYGECVSSECDTSHCFPLLSGITLTGGLKAQQKLTL